ncbi:nitrate reductase molybdenum cofactor assembly chaperone [Bacillus sp. L381]|uniref:nitrate reductase molybdenum cofactor assembly chaperone n=1 Tax=Bacillus TaxID=1386 RepID=UPI001BA46708|nr:MULTISPECIES: nitrate reductase molybdenum cofactor assembly chaperone [Bacillus]MCR9039845.1 nitrate reductase molybdenum cofactor assembly chaperone [Bacillus velezensis]QUN09359.1 nitrate reductase molybdenum cofactor assembly chaperone [Bacillus amyloliquefaciens]QYM82433.1 nitrate reductase molybdenum cofactor assembly chaperone [Bacillus sp. 7D3]QZY11660.1 nitrate reductase molybdenum cofactor assembly chaperone [Bacillus amyloliquefaciens]WIX21482.1 nitrate reductase molybdenum cofac
MNTTDRQITFSALSCLLSYPDEEWRAELPDWKTLILDISSQEIRKKLLRFLKAAAGFSQEALIEHYVYTFDFGKKTNMYVTYFNSGEQRERGIELLHLKNTYQQSGFLPTEKELPDYLPLMLEFAAIAEIEAARSVFEKYLSNVRELASRLEKNDSIYAGLLHVLIAALEDIGVRESKEGAVQA